MLHPALPYTEAEVIWAARHEMARTVEDVLARRTRALFLNARAAMAMAPARRGVARARARPRLVVAVRTGPLVLAIWRGSYLCRAAL